MPASSLRVGAVTGRAAPQKDAVVHRVAGAGQIRSNDDRHGYRIHRDEPEIEQCMEVGSKKEVIRDAVAAGLGVGDDVRCPQRPGNSATIDDAATALDPEQLPP